MAAQIHYWSRVDTMSGPAGEKITLMGEREIALALNGSPASKYIRVDADMGGGKTEYTISDGVEWLGKVNEKKADEFLKKELDALKEKQAEEKAFEKAAAEARVKDLKAQLAAEIARVEEEAGISHKSKKK